MSNYLPTVGLLHAGELGAALAAPLVSRGVRVVTCAAGRSVQTANRCRSAGIQMVDTLESLVRSANIVLSVVPPSAAEEVARTYATMTHVAPRGAVFVDMNSIGPDLAQSIGVQMAEANCGFVDASVHGQACNLSTGSTVYFAGIRASEVAQLFSPDFRTRVISDRPGDASAMKMLLGGLSKSLCALFLEIASLAQRRDMLGELLDESKRFYPGIVSAVERMLPTYPRHAGRRADEMAQVQNTSARSGQTPVMVASAQRLLASVASTRFGADVSPAQWNIEALVHHLCDNGFLSSPSVEGDQNGH